MLLQSIIMGCALSFGALAPVNAGTVVVVQDDADDKQDLQLSQMLTRLGLGRLELRRAELQLSRELDSTKQRQLARALAEHYYQYLLTSISQSQDGEASILDRAKTLIQNYPEVESPNLRLAMAHAEYQSWEAKFGVWWSAVAPPEQRDEIVSGFRDLLSSIDREILGNEAMRQGALDEIPFDEAQAADRQRKLSQIEGRLLHAHFLRGWTCYFLAVATFQQDVRLMPWATDSFCHALQIDAQQPIETIDKKWLGLSSPLNRRALLGLALVYSAQHRITASQYCFRAIAPYGSENEFQGIWPFYGLIYSRQWTAAIDFLKAEDPQRTWRSQQLKQRLWSATYVAGRIAAATDSQDGRELQALGLMGILRMGNPERLTTIAQTHQLQLQSDVFADRWISGVLAHHKAKPLSKGLQTARDHFLAALDLATAETPRQDIARIRFQLALVEYQSTNFSASLAHLAELPSVRTQLPTEIAERVFWLRTQNQMALARRDVRQIGPALEALNQWATEFPNSSFSSQIAFDRLKLSNRLVPPPEALKKLDEIPASSPHFLEARFETIKVKYQVWSEAHRRTSSDEVSAYEDLIACDYDYRTLPQTTPQQKLASLFFVVDACLRRDSQRTDFEQWMAVAEPLAVDPAGKRQLMYYRFQGAKRFEDNEVALETARWLSSHAKESERQVAGMIYLAQHADQSDTHTTTQLIELYERLAERLGTDDLSLSQSRNARVVAGRLTELHLQQGDFDAADALNNRLVALFPNQQRYQLNAARSQMGRNDLQAALPFWRRLARGSKAGSEVWLESKLGVIECLLMRDPSLAQKVFKQTRQLAAPIPSTWQARFDQLETRLLVAVDQAQTPSR